MKIAITGANSNLAKYLLPRLGKNFQGIEISEFSSTPTKLQKNFSVSGNFDLTEFEEIHSLIHCARQYTPDFESINREIEILDQISSLGIKIFNIGSVSSYLQERNVYGNYKKIISDWTVGNGHSNIVCGLIFGKEFFGQIYQLRRILKYIPVVPKFSEEGDVFLSYSIDILDKLLKGLIGEKFINSYLISEKPIRINGFLRDLSGKYSLSLIVSKRIIKNILEIFPRNNYFNSDSFTGFNAKYNKFNAESKNFLDFSYIENRWREYIDFRSIE